MSSAITKNNESTKALKDFKTQIIESTEKIIKEYLPIKVVQLSELFDEISAKQTDIERRKYEFDTTPDDSKTNSKESKGNTNTKNTNKISASARTSKKKRSFNDMNIDQKQKENNNKSQIA